MHAARVDERKWRCAEPAGMSHLSKVSSEGGGKVGTDQTNTSR